MADVFVFLARAAACLTRDAGLGRLGRRGAFQGLDAGLFIRTDEADALRVQLRRGGVEVADCFDLRAELRRIPLRGVEPTRGMRQIKVELI